MSRPRRVTLRLDLDLASEPIEGEVGTPDGPLHPFTGWLGLAGALERAASGDGEIETTQGDDRVP